jgi:hypothetical protein
LSLNAPRSWVAKNAPKRRSPRSRNWLRSVIRRRPRPPTGPRAGAVTRASS